MSDTETASPDAGTASGDDSTSGEVHLSAWTREGVGNEFKQDEVLDLLRDLPLAYGVKYIDYADYVQILPSTKTVKVPSERNPSVTVDMKVPAWTVYMSVAGRVRMLNDIAELNDWIVDFEPEPTTPTGIPGLLRDDSMIVYRERLTIYQARATPGAEPRRLGTRSGMAYVPGPEDRKNAARSNPYEKVETAARGRAIAAWGIGVLPGSGIASLEEVQGAAQNEREIERRASRGPGGARNGDTVRETRPEILEQVQSMTEELRQIAGIEQDAAIEKNAQWLEKGYGLTDLIDPKTGTMNWSRVNDGQLLQLRNLLRTNLQKVTALGQGDA